MADFLPQTKYVIHRRLYNQQDFGQKYVKAYVRDPITSRMLLDGAEMTEENSQGDFEYNWQLPVDGSGLGRQLIIWSVVYTSAAYTTRDKNYGDEQHGIRVVDPRLLTGGGGGGGIDYRKVRKIIKEEIGREMKSFTIDGKDIISYVKVAEKSILSRIQGINTLIKDIKIPRYKTLLNKIIELIIGIEIPKPTNVTKLEKKADKVLSNQEILNENVVEVSGKIKKSKDIEVSLDGKVAEKITDNINTHTTKEFRNDRLLREPVEETIYEIDKKI